MLRWGAGAPRGLVSLQHRPRAQRTVIEWRMDKSADQRYTVESFEGEWAVLEVSVGETLNVPGAWLPKDAGEGDVLRVSLESGAGESAVRFTLDAEATQERRDSVRELREGLPKAPEGDLEL